MTGPCRRLIESNFPQSGQGFTCASWVVAAAQMERECERGKRKKYIGTSMPYYRSCTSAGFHGWQAGPCECELLLTWQRRKEVTLAVFTSTVQSRQPNSPPTQLFYLNHPLRATSPPFLDQQLACKGTSTNIAPDILCGLLFWSFRVVIFVHSTRLSLA